MLRSCQVVSDSNVSKITWPFTSICCVLLIVVFYVDEKRFEAMCWFLLIHHFEIWLPGVFVKSSNLSCQETNLELQSLSPWLSSSVPITRSVRTTWKNIHLFCSLPLWCWDSNCNRAHRCFYADLCTRRNAVFPCWRIREKQHKLKNMATEGKTGLIRLKS